MARWVMAKSIQRKRRLQDTYTFPGFRPKATVKGVFGDPKARVVSLERRSKKRAAAVAVVCIGFGTTAKHAAFATCPLAARGCIWSSMYIGSSARPAAR